MKKLPLLSVSVALLALVTASCRSSDPLGDDAVGSLSSLDVRQIQSPSQITYDLEIEKAEARRRTAKVRCTGMVASARQTCLSDADRHYEALELLAQRNQNYVETRSIPIAFKH